MGSWGKGNFDNDAAIDWVGQLVDTGDEHFIVRAFRHVIEPRWTSYAEAPDCCEALAAAEIVAATLGGPSSELPREAIEWISRNRPSFRPEVVALACEAVRRVITDSELKKLRDHPLLGKAEEWYAVVVDLERRLSGHSR